MRRQRLLQAARYSRPSPRCGAKGFFRQHASAGQAHDAAPKAARHMHARSHTHSVVDPAVDQKHGSKGWRGGPAQELRRQIVARLLLAAGADGSMPAALPASFRAESQVSR